MVKGLLLPANLLIGQTNANEEVYYYKKDLLNRRLFYEKTN